MEKLMQEFEVGVRNSILNRMVRQGLTVKAEFELRSEAGEGVLR